MPTTIPRDSFSDMTDNNQGQKLTVGFKGHFVRDMDPLILYQFNRLIGGSMNHQMLNNDLPLFNSNDLTFDGRWASTPYILTKSIKDKYRGTYNEYYLQWKA